MITYEWCRLPTGGFLAYANDDICHCKMITFGSSHQRICHNFAVMLWKSKKLGAIQSRRFIMAQDENKELYNKFGQYKRGKIIKDKIKIKTSAEAKVERQLKEEADNKLKDELLRQKEIEESFDRYITETNDNGDVLIYGVKLIKIYKTKRN